MAHETDRQSTASLLESRRECFVDEQHEGHFAVVTAHVVLQQSNLERVCPLKTEMSEVNTI